VKDATEQLQVVRNYEEGFSDHEEDKIVIHLYDEV